MNNQSTMGLRRWASIAGWVYFSAGVALAVISFFPAALLAVTRLAVPSAGPPDLSLGLYAGVAGGLTAGLGAAALSAARQHSGSRAVALGIATWFLVDTSASLLHGSWQNALGNLMFLIIGLPPLWLLGATPLPDGNPSAAHASMAP